MSKKIFYSIIAVAMIVLLLSLIITTGFLYDYFNKTQVDRLKEELTLACVGVERLGESYFDGYDSSVFRFTLVRADGDVIYDSEAESAEMENHIDREEIAEALKNGRGSSARYSSTLTERTFYEAIRLTNGNVLRISATQVTIGALVIGMSPAICAVIIFSVVVAIFLSQRMAKSIVKPLNELDLESPTENDAYEELTPILARLNLQHKQIAGQLRELKQKADEFRQITSCMNEGLVLLDGKGTVLSANEAAEKIFNVDIDAVGGSFLMLDRTPAMTAAVKKAFSGKHSEFREERNGGEYQFMISPTVSEGSIIGVVILCIDVTETAFAERNRQEFTANVSHELKTPLQSIIGSAELLENGLVKPEDTSRFVGNIKKEASRLVTLINDIIRLSQLDEKTELPSEEVDLYAVASEVVEELTGIATQRNVSISLDGTSCTIRGIRRYLYEIIYNLCDNAIRYNKDGGEVKIAIEKSEGNVTLKVSDTGIGIPAEYQSRIFERFYRVDKSHSKETGGTGLGLSIVKHAVAYHNGKIKLASKVGEGTTVSVEL